MIHPQLRQHKFINEYDVGHINVSYEQYEAKMHAVSVSTGVYFLTTDQISNGGKFFVLLGGNIHVNVTDLSGDLKPVILLHALNECLEYFNFKCLLYAKFLGETSPVYLVHQ